jgi:hypothetical protein
MPPEYKTRHRKLPPDARITTRQPVQPEAKDREQLTPEGYERIGFDRLQGAVETLARLTENRGYPVDEYESAAISGAASSTGVTVLPTYEYMWEKIESIIIVGPAGTVTLQLGDRIWALTIPASGILVIAPVGVRLSRADARILTAGTPGAYSLELCGIADRRFNI